MKSHFAQQACCKTALFLFEVSAESHLALSIIIIIIFIIFINPQPVLVVKKGVVSFELGLSAITLLEIHVGAEKNGKGAAYGEIRSP